MFLKSRAKSSVILAITTCLILSGSTLPVFSITPSNITILSPGLNTMFISTTVSVSGTFVSPQNPPSITVYVDGTAYGTSISVSSSTTDTTTGTWSASVSGANGWHQLKATISDTNGVLSDSSQFYTNDGTAIMAQIKYPAVINVEYTPACRALLNSGDTTSCPPLGDLIPFDTSDQRISGHFINSIHGVIRDYPQMKNAYQFYKGNVTCIECLIDANSQSQMQIIWIEPRGFSYTQHDFTGTTVTNYERNNTGITTYTSTVNEQNAGLLVYHDKYVDGGCMSAEVVYKDKNTIPSTVKYLRDGCKDPNFFNTTTTQIPYHPFSFDNQYSSLHGQTYLASIFHGHKTLTNEKMPTGGGLGPGNCIGKTKCPYTDPYKKAGY